MQMSPPAFSQEANGSDDERRLHFRPNPQSTPPALREMGFWMARLLVNFGWIIHTGRRMQSATLSIWIQPDLGLVIPFWSIKVVLKSIVLYTSTFTKKFPIRACSSWVIGLSINLSKNLSILNEMLCYMLVTKIWHSQQTSSKLGLSNVFD